MSRNSFLELHSEVLKNLLSDSVHQLVNSEKYRKSISKISRVIADRSNVTLDSSSSTSEKSRLDSTEVKKTTEKRRTRTAKNINYAIARSYKKKQYQPKVRIKKISESLGRQTSNYKVSEKTPKDGDNPFISVATSTPNCDKTLSDENPSSKSISFPMETNSSTSNSGLGEDFSPVLNKMKTNRKNNNLSQKKLIYDDNSTEEQGNNKQKTVEEAVPSSLKRRRPELSRKVKNNSNEDKNNTTVNNLENSSKKRKLLKHNETQNKEYRKTPKKPSPNRENKMLEKSANTKSVKNLGNKTVEKSVQQPLVEINKDSNSDKANWSSNVNNRMNNRSDSNNKADKENTKKLKLNKTNQLKKLRSDKNGNHIVEKNVETNKNNNDDPVNNNPRRSNSERQSNTKNSSIPKNTAVRIVSSKDVLTDVIFLPPPLKENYKSLRASLSKKNNSGRTSCSGRSSTSMSISSSDSDICITGEMIADPKDGQEYVHDMSLSVKPAWLKNIMKTVKENNANSDAKKRGSEGANNEQYLLKEKRKKLIRNCPISLNEVTTSDLNFFQKVSSCPELKTWISKFHFELYVHEQLNSIKNELTREDTKWKINLLLRRALLKDRNSNETADC